MPELPEVETIRRDLDGVLTGKVVAGVAVADRRALEGFRPDGSRRRRVDPADFGRRLTGRGIVGVSRRGKYLLFHLDDGSAFLAHLRMTGRLLWGAPRSDARLLVRFEGTDDVLNFCDVRRFGEFWIAEKGREDRSVGALGPEPLEPMDEADFARRLRRSRAKLHAALLDQKRIAGLGNIYVTEALWRAGWRPTRRARALPAEAVPGLLESVREALRDGLARRGVSFRDYRDAWGEKGRAGETLAVYGRAGKPCPRCGTTLKGVKVGGRGTAFCPRCQR